MLFPIGVENAQVDRVPWVSIGIAVLCVGVFCATCGDHPVDEKLVTERADRVVEFAAQHPWLTVPTECRAYVESRLERDDPDQPSVDGAPTAPAVRREQQAAINALCAQVVSLFTRPAFAKWGFTPARGFFRPGVVTHIFLHADIFHLLGNLLFFYIVALLLEDIWGRLVFGIFYVVAGVLAGCAQALLDLNSAVPIIGASGAIAACMGAFTLRFATRRIKMAYWFGIFLRGTFHIPAWLWGGLWFLHEVFTWRTGTAGGVAVMAHIGGFVVGFGTALAIKATGFEQKVLMPMVTGLGPSKEMDPDLIEGNRAMDAGNWALAKQHYRKTINKLPADLDAWLGLARVARQLGDEPGMHKALDRLVALSTEDEPSMQDLVAEFGAGISPSLLGPQAARRLARYFERKDPPRALQLHQAGGAGEDEASAMSMLRAAELLSDENPSRAMAFAQAAMGKQGVTRDVQVRGQAVLSRLTPASAPVVTRQVVMCRFLGRAVGGWTVQAQDGRSTLLQPAHVKSVAAALVPDSQGGVMLWTDVVMHGGVVLRFAGNAMGLELLYPGHPPQDAHRGLMNELNLPGVTMWPSAQELIAGRYPQLGSLDELGRV